MNALLGLPGADVAERPRGMAEDVAERFCPLADDVAELVLSQAAAGGEAGLAADSLANIRPDESSCCAATAAAAAAARLADLRMEADPAAAAAGPACMKSEEEKDEDVVAGPRPDPEAGLLLPLLLLGPAASDCTACPALLCCC